MINYPNNFIGNSHKILKKAISFSIFDCIIEPP